MSVVIPTFNRPKLVCRAIESALGQTVLELEVIVVVDGRDVETAGRLNRITDPRLRCIELAEHRGGSGARNVGVNAARGAWIAFLDDDDEWFPQKIEKQMMLAGGSQYRYPIICSRVIARSASGDLQWPRKPPRLPLCDYLFCRASLFQGEGLMQTSSLLTKRQLLLDIPFQEGLRKHQDWDWLLRAVNARDAGIEFVPEALLIWYIDHEGPRLSGEVTPSLSLEWLQKSRGLLTPEAYAAFLLTIVAPQMLQGSGTRSLPSLLLQACRQGKPRLMDLVLFFGFCVVPRRLRHVLRSSLS